MFKRLLAALFSFVILISATTLSVIIIARGIFSEETLTKIVDVLIKEEDINSLYEENLTSPEEKAALEVFFNNEEIKKEYVSIYRNSLLYYLGVSNIEKPSTNNLKNILNNYCIEYKNKTGIEIDSSVFNEYLNTFEKNTNESEGTFEQIRKVINYIYSEKIFNTIIALIGVCILFIYLLKRNLFDTFKSISTAAIINGVGVSALGSALVSVLNSSSTNSQEVLKIADIISKLFYNVGVTSLASGIILIVIISIVKKRFIKNSHGINNTLTSSEDNKNPIFNYNPINDVQDNIKKY